MSDQIEQDQYSASVSEPALRPVAAPDTLPPEAVISPAVRQRIVREATRLFSQKGYNGVSVREIVEAAGITKPTLYYYYPGKEVLFERIIVEALEDFRRQLETAIREAGTIRERLVLVARVFLDFARCNAEHFQLVHDVCFSSESKMIQFDLDAYFRGNIERIRDLLSAGMASGEVRAGDAWLMALVLVGAIHLFSLAVVRDPSAVPNEGLAEIVVDNTMKGMEPRSER